jgi:hypothetical protein
MIDLKLAEYNSEGRFKKFLELGKDFLFGGNFLMIHIVTIAPLTEENRVNREIPKITLEEGKVFKDEKDPLNRFDGLFDGFTYGNGRFVLIDKKHKFDIYETRYVVDIRHYTFRKIRHCVSSEIIGNLHQNPELYEKVKETSRWGLFDESRVRWKDVL